MNNTAIEVNNLSKCFRFYDKKWRQFAGLFLGARNHARELWAIRNLSFKIQKGITLAIVGPNGSGKTTLLQLLAGLMKPTEGSVQVQGNLATLLELGSAFQQDLTGRENIFINSGLRGFSKRDVEQRFKEIVAFSELEEFIDRPIKHYSSGMLMRLGFATAINMRPDVLLIDEVFAVGDMAFQHKCSLKFRELQKNGSTIVLVTHDMTAAKSLCNQALLLDRGEQVLFGHPEQVTNKYLALTAQKIAQQTISIESKEPSSLEQTEIPFLTDLNSCESMHRHGDREAQICGVQILNENGSASNEFSFGEQVTFRFFLEYRADIPFSILGFYIRDLYGNDIVGINTHEEDRPIGPRKRGDRIIVDFRLPLNLRSGSYSASPGLSYHWDQPQYLDWIDNVAVFTVNKPITGKRIHGLMWVPNEVIVRVCNERKE